MIEFYYDIRKHNNAEKQLLLTTTEKFGRQRHGRSFDTRRHPDGPGSFLSSPLPIMLRECLGKTLILSSAPFLITLVLALNIALFGATLGIFYNCIITITHNKMVLNFLCLNFAPQRM